MLEEILHRGVAHANQRARLILLDIFWKVVWLVCTAAAVLLLVSWLGSRLSGLAWEDTGNRSVNAFIATALARQLWQTYGRTVLVAGIVFVVVAVTVWFVLEAWARSRMVRVVAGVSPMSPATFLASRVAKTFVLFVTALLLLPVVRDGAPGLALVIFMSLAFCLALVETLVRTGAVQLAGTDLIRVTGLLGILMSFELTIAVSFSLFLTAGFLNVARLTDALVMLGATGLVVVFLTIMHSYLLLVRFSTIVIMRQNALEI
jgi:hypothetical protein